MKITLWQQFSSNHSGYFSIVGVFDTPEKAKKAADELAKIIKTIQDWHKNNPDKSDAWYARWASGDEYPAPLSEIEENLAKKYDVRWPNGIDWFDDAKIEIIRDHIVHMTTEFQVDWGPQPFDQIIARLGGYGLVTGMSNGGEPDGSIWIKLSCTAPDEATAIKIAESKPAFIDFDKTIQHVRRYDAKLHFGWEWYESTWKLEKLIDELQQQNCTDIEYSFSAVTHIETTSYRVSSEPKG
jgi:hypothetical protein